MFEGLVVPYLRTEYEIEAESTVESVTRLTTTAQWSEMNSRFTQLAFQLIRRNTKEFVVHILHSILQSYRLFALLVPALALSALLVALRRDFVLASLLGFSVVAFIANVVGVFGVEVGMGRYLFYTDFLVILMCVLAVDAISSARTALA
jgi:hypothetical protein